MVYILSEKVDVIKYYSLPIVRREIADYSRGRWIAVFAKANGAGFFVRYWSKTGPPLTISSEKDIGAILSRFKGIGPRTFYASINIYSNISRESIDDPNNIQYCTPIWDIDGSVEYWERIVDVARIILEELDRYGLSKSVYLKWSGRGIHIHIHERAISGELREKYNPLDIAYSIVDYILQRCKDKILEVMKATSGGERPLKVENEVDLKRVFTVPLSLHKFLDYAAVCFKPNQIDDFNIEWADPNKMKHNPDWRIFQEGEADELARIAIKEVGGYLKRVGEIRTVVQHEPVKVERKTRRRGPVKVGRFQVMALLQAARYYLLTGDIKKAKSFGLNRAIFYAWAKRHARGRVFRRKLTGVEKEVEYATTKEGKKMVYVGDEGAFLSDRGWFIIGDKEQLPQDFDKEIAEKISTIIPYEKAWQAALEYLKSFPKNVLLNQQKFYNEVYKPIRDVFFERILKGKKPRTGLDVFLTK